MALDFIPVAALQLDDAVRHHDNFVICVAFLRGLVSFPRENDLDFELVSGSFEHSGNIRWVHVSLLVGYIILIIAVIPKVQVEPYGRPVA